MIPAIVVVGSSEPWSQSAAQYAVMARENRMISDFIPSFTAKHFRLYSASYLRIPWRKTFLNFACRDDTRESGFMLGNTRTDFLFAIFLPQKSFSRVFFAPPHLPTPVPNRLLNLVNLLPLSIHLTFLTSAHNPKATWLAHANSPSEFAGFNSFSLKEGRLRSCKLTGHTCSSVFCRLSHHLFSHISFSST